MNLTSSIGIEAGNITVNITSSEDGNYKLFLECAQFITGLVLYPILCLFGITGNILSIIVLSQKKMHTSTNVYLTALGVADTIKLLNDAGYFICILLTKINKVAGEKALFHMYPYAHYVLNMSACITAWLTVAVAVERYIMVCHATRAREFCNMKRSKYVSIATFISMSILTLPFAFRYETVFIDNAETPEYDLSWRVNVTDLWMSDHFSNAFIWITYLLRSVIPLVILCVVNYHIVQALRKTRSTKKRVTSRQRITLMLISVIIVFVVCFTPDAIMSMVFRLGYYDANYLVRGIREITDLLLTVNSAVNFIIYCIFNKLFRKNFAMLFCKKYVACKCQPATSQVLPPSSFSSIRGTIMNGSAASRHQIPLCLNEFNEWNQSVM